MSISINQWRVETGMFFRKSKIKYRERILLPTICPLLYCSSGFRFVFVMLILLTCGDIESNPGRRIRDSCYNFSVCHWNLNSMTVHNFEKINLLEAYKFDVIYLSESYLDSSIASDNDDLNINGYNLYRINRPNNIKRGGVCAYIRESLPVRCLSSIYLQECLVLKISVNNKMLFHWIDPLVKLQMNLTPLLIIWRNS